MCATIAREARWLRESVNGTPLTDTHSVLLEFFCSDRLPSGVVTLALQSLSPTRQCWLKFESEKHTRTCVNLSCKRCDVFEV